MSLPIKEPAASQYEAEYRYQFEAKDPAWHNVVVQGSVDVESEVLEGFSLDEFSTE